MADKIQVPIDKDVDDLGVGFERVKPGQYHMQFRMFEPYSTKSGAHKVMMEVLAASPENMSEVGGEHVEFFSSAPSQNNPESKHWSERMLLLALAARLVDKDYLKRCRNEGIAPEIDYEQIAGRQCFVELIEDQDLQGRKQIKIGNIGYAIYPLDDPRCRDFPRNVGMLAKVGAGEPPVEGALDNLV